MAKLVRWSDAWVSSRRPAAGEAERVYPDPEVARHRLVVTRTLKKFEATAAARAARAEEDLNVFITGIFPDVDVEMSREKANVIIGRIRRGEDPRERPAEKETTLGGAWERYKLRDDLKPRTLAMYEGHYRRNLEKWEGPLASRTRPKTQHLRRRAQGDHRARRTVRGGPCHAPSTLDLLPCGRRARPDATGRQGPQSPDCASGRGARTGQSGSGGSWHGDRKRTGAAIQPEGDADMEASSREVRQGLAARSARRSMSFCCASGADRMSPAAAEWPNVSTGSGKVLWISHSKEQPYEVPLSPQAVTEFKKLREARALNRGDRDFVFPSRVGKRGHGHLAQYTEPKDVLLRTSNALRHTHHTLGTRLGIKEIVLDVMEGPQHPEERRGWSRLCRHARAWTRASRGAGNH